MRFVEYHKTELPNATVKQAKRRVYYPSESIQEKN